MTSSLVSLLDQALYVSISKPSKPQGSISGPVDDLTALQSSYGGRIDKTHLKMGAESLYHLSADLIDQPCLLQSVYRAINRLKAFKDTRPNTGDYTQYRIDVIPFVDQLTSELDQIAIIRDDRATKQADIDRAARHAGRLERRETRKARTATRRAEERRLKEEMKAAKEAKRIALLNTSLKTCRKCSETKTLDAFNHNRHRPDGYSMYCRVCCKRDHYLPNREGHKARSLAWHRAHPERSRENRKRAKHRPYYRVSRNIRRRIKHYIDDLSHITSRQDIIGCSPKELVAHLEAQFAPEMTWANYGTHWHIDHIIPCAAFDFDHPNHLRWCWHHRNLRPLSAVENIAKRDLLSNGENAASLKRDNRALLMDIVAHELDQMGIASKQEVVDSYESTDRVQVLMI